MYIDSSRRLGDLLLCMERQRGQQQQQLYHADGHDEEEEEGRPYSYHRQLEGPSASPSRSLQPLLLRHLTDLYLAPFEGGRLDDQPTALWVRELLCSASETLRRLVVHMPFGSLDPLDDHLSVRRALRDGFEQLAGLEEFVCLGEYPALSVGEAHTDVWRLWPGLRRLALFHAPADDHWLWWDVATLSKLERVVLARPANLDGGGGDGTTVNIKDQYFHKLPRDHPALDRRIRITLLGAAYELPDELTVDGWDVIDPRGRMTVDAYHVPMPFYGDESPADQVTGWVRRGALDGTLWDWEGKVVTSASDTTA